MSNQPAKFRYYGVHTETGFIHAGFVAIYDAREWVTSRIAGAYHIETPNGEVIK